VNLKGYDPGLSVQSALKLPQSLDIVDSITSAVANADYISINIPYVKGEGGTHGIIGEEVISHFKQDAVLLNFARGELVDSDSMKKFLDSGDGRYVSDFPDALWNKNAVLFRIWDLHRRGETLPPMPTPFVTFSRWEHPLGNFPLLPCRVPGTTFAAPLSARTSGCLAAITKLLLKS
jgi:hypothetical protein